MDFCPLRRHIYRVRVPSEPGKKTRPALIVSPDVRNRLASDGIVVPLTTVLRPAPTHVRLKKREGGLNRSSMVKAEQVTTLPKAFLHPKPLGGPISPGRMVEVEKAVVRAMGVPVD